MNDGKANETSRAKAPPRKPWLNPITRKRLRRFREMKRAWWSLWVLAALYVISLGAELVCNSVPLIVHMDDNWYFPVFRSYPDDVFTASGLQTRPDYRQIAESPGFAAESGNWMLWPPVPHGPYEIEDPDDIEIPDTVTLRLVPQPKVASVNLTPELAIVRPQATEGLFDDLSPRELEGMPFEEFWPLPAQVRNGIQRRFENQESEAVEATVTDDAGGELTLSLPRFSARSRPPRTVRLTLRAAKPAGARPLDIVFERPGQPVSGDLSQWDQVPEEVQAQLLERVGRRFGERVASWNVELHGHDYRAEFEREEVRFPFRPVPGHWLGLDEAGRDVLARILYGLRTSLTFGLILVCASVALGIVVGALQGYFAGALDISVQRVIEIWSALPFLYIMILLGSVYGRSFGLLLFCYGLFNWIGMSYYMRAEFLRLRHQPFVEAARCMGLPAWKIIFRHILPNALVPVVTLLPFSLVGAIGSLAALDYLGFGLPPPTPSWGELLHQAQVYRWAWWLILYPSLALFTVMLLGVFVGEGVRNAYDPRRYSRLE